MTITAQFQAPRIRILGQPMVADAPPVTPETPPNGDVLKLDYEAHTMVCVDLAAEGMPVTTTGCKPVDTHVDDFDQAYLYFGPARFSPPVVDLTLPRPLVAPRIYGHDSAMDPRTGKLLVVGGFGYNYACDVDAVEVADPGRKPVLSTTLYGFGFSRGNIPIRFAPLVSARQSYYNGTSNKTLMADGQQLIEATVYVYDSDPVGTIYYSVATPGKVLGVKMATINIVDGTSVVVRSVINVLQEDRFDLTGLPTYFDNGFIQKGTVNGINSLGYGPDTFIQRLAVNQDSISTREFTQSNSGSPSSGSREVYYDEYKSGITGSDPESQVVARALTPDITVLSDFTSDSSGASQGPGFNLRGGYAFYKDGNVYSLGMLQEDHAIRPFGQSFHWADFSLSIFDVYDNGSGSPAPLDDSLFPGAPACTYDPPAVNTLTVSMRNRMNGKFLTMGDQGDYDYWNFAYRNTGYQASHAGNIPLAPAGYPFIDGRSTYDPSDEFIYSMTPCHTTSERVSRVMNSGNSYSQTNASGFPFFCVISMSTSFDNSDLAFGFGNPQLGEDYGPRGIVRHTQTPYFFVASWATGNVESMDWVDTTWQWRDRDPFDKDQINVIRSPQSGKSFALPREAVLGQTGAGDTFIFGGYQSSSRLYSTYISKRVTETPSSTSAGTSAQYDLFHSQRVFLYSGDYYQEVPAYSRAKSTGATGDNAAIINSPAPAVSSGVLGFDTSIAIPSALGIMDLTVLDPQISDRDRLSATGSISSGRFGHTVTHIGGSKFLIVGGWEALPTTMFEWVKNAPCDTVEIFDANTGTTTVVGHLERPRGYHHCLKLPSGAFFISGGDQVPDDRYPDSTLANAVEACAPFLPSYEIITAIPFVKVAFGELDYFPVGSDGMFAYIPPGEWRSGQSPRYNLSIYQQWYRFTGQTGVDYLGLYPTAPDSLLRSTQWTESDISLLHGELRYTLRGHTATYDALRGKIHLVGGFHGMSLDLATGCGAQGRDNRYLTRFYPSLMDIPYPVLFPYQYGSENSHASSVQVDKQRGVAADAYLSNLRILPFYLDEVVGVNSTTDFLDDLDSGSLDARMNCTRILEPMLLWDQYAATSPGGTPSEDDMEHLRHRGIRTLNIHMANNIFSMDASIQ